MPFHKTSDILHCLRRIAHPQNVQALTDAELLARFVTEGDDTAIESLVRRHGPMVWSVCRRILPDSHDAEDAFQATFLVLIRKRRVFNRGKW